MRYAELITAEQAEESGRYSEGQFVPETAIWNMVAFPQSRTQGHTTCPECNGAIDWYSKIEVHDTTSWKGSCSCGPWLMIYPPAM
jgi:hypothetical protein